jgi:hypothetical protein
MSANNKRNSNNVVKSLIDDLEKDNQALPDEVLRAPGAKSQTNGDDDRTTLLPGAPPAPPPFKKKPPQFPIVNELPVDEFSSSNAATKVVGSKNQPPVIPDTPIDFPEPAPQTTFGVSGSVPTQPGLAQFESLKLAQQRILELEREVENLRRDNESLAAGQEANKNKLEELFLKAQSLEKSRDELRDQSEADLRIMRDSLQYKEAELARFKLKLQETDGKVTSDIKRVRVRERELENRLELVRIEKNALLKSKDDMILELKRKMDFLSTELESYKEKYFEQNQRLEANQEKLSRAARAMRATLTNIEVEEIMNTNPSAKLKKAE